MQTEPTYAVPELDPNPGASLNQADEAESECLTTARELRILLQDEAGILKRFAGSELLWLIPKKELLINELGQKLNTRFSGQRSPSNADHLRSLLGEIDEMNRSNGLFILRTLSYWQDLLSIFSPRTYGPAGEGSRSPAPAIRGRAFSREI
ncbi:MAG: hypothetical protein AB9866_06020 [Syntrophobacteraceae bacterium]